MDMYTSLLVKIRIKAIGITQPQYDPSLFLLFEMIIIFWVVRSYNILCATCEQVGGPFPPAHQQSTLHTYEIYFF